MKDRGFLVGFLIFLLIATIISVVTYLKFFSSGPHTISNDFFGTLVFLLVFILVIFISVIRQLVKEAENCPRGKNEASKT